jgi:hypothetical protein
MCKAVLRAASAACVAVLVGGCAGSSHDAAGPASEPLAAAGVQGPAEPVFHPESQRVLKGVSDRLAANPQFSFSAEAWDDQPLGPHKLSTTKLVTVKVRRPNGLQADLQTPRRSRSFWFDGTNFSVLDRTANVFGTVPAPATLEAALEAMQSQYGITIPLDDLLVDDVYSSAIRTATAGAYFGKVTILGVPCEHVAFSTPAVDWQMWVEQGGSGMPKKITITYKNEPMQPQYTAIFSNWSLGGPFAADSFTFTPPAGAVPAKLMADAPAAAE